MSNAYDMISASLNELTEDIELNDGKNLSTSVLEIDVAPVKKFSASEIKNIRLKNNLTQSILANFLCVSKKTIEAWEAGRNVPNGPSSRLLELLNNNSIQISHTC